LLSATLPHGFSIFLDGLCGALLKLGFNMKNLLASIYLSVSLAVTSAFTSVAHAAVPAAATTAITGIQTDGTAMIDAGWPVAAALVGGFILIKLFKKVMGKVS